MKTISLSLYSFDELSPKAKQKAIEDYRNNKYSYESFAIQDFWETCQAIGKIFPISIQSLDAEAYRTEFTIEDYPYDDDGNEGTTFETTFETYIKSAKYPDSKDNMQLTGTYSDIAFLESLPKSVPLTRENFREAMRALQKSLEEEYANEFSDESISETLIANDYNFLEDGTIYS